MEEAISFLYHVFGTLLFCIALAFLFTASSVEQQAVDQLHKQATETAWYQR
jgi:hypothetical protein